MLRKSYIEENIYHNIDILFEGVFYVQTPTSFDYGFELYKGDEADKEYITPFIGVNPYWQFNEVYIVKSKEREYFICAVRIFISKNDLPPGKTSILMTKE